MLQVNVATARNPTMDSKKTVLIVDDDQLVLESIDLSLSSAGKYQEIRAHGAAGALSQMQQAHIDVVVTDVILADCDSGIDICEAAIKRHPDVAIVVVTADPEVDCAEVPARGVFLRKPFGAEQLLSAIDQALEKRRLG